MKKLLMKVEKGLKNICPQASCPQNIQGACIIQGWDEVPCPEVCRALRDHEEYLVYLDRLDDYKVLGDKA